jgi:hypothetical protein
MGAHRTSRAICFLADSFKKNGFLIPLLTFSRSNRAVSFNLSRTLAALLLSAICCFCLRDQ